MNELRHDSAPIKQDTVGQLLSDYERLISLHGVDSEAARIYRDNHSGSKEFIELSKSLDRLHQSLPHDSTDERRNRELRHKFYRASICLVVVGCVIAAVIVFGLYNTWRYHNETKTLQKRTSELATAIEKKATEADKSSKDAQGYLDKVVSVTIKMAAAVESGSGGLRDSNLTEEEKRILGRILTKNELAITSNVSFNPVLDDIVRAHPSRVVYHLKDKDRDVRLTTVRALITFLSSPKRPELPLEIVEAVPDIVNMLVDDEQQHKLHYRRSAMDVLQMIGKPAVPTLVQSLRDLPPDKSRAQSDIIYALGRIKKDASEAVNQIIKTGLDHPDASVRWRAISALGDIGVEANVAATKIRALLTNASANENDTKVKQLSIIALGKIGAKDAETIKDLITILQNTKENNDVRVAAAVALGEIGTEHTGVLKALSATLNDYSFEVRNSVAIALGKVGGNALSEILPKLNDNNPINQQGAAIALGSMSKEYLNTRVLLVIDKLVTFVDPDTNTSYFKLFTPKKDSKEHRLAVVKAIEALGTIGRFIRDLDTDAARDQLKRTEAVLGKVMKKDEPFVFRETAETVSKLGFSSESTIGILEERFDKSNDPTIQVAAANALGRIGIGSVAAAHKVAGPLLHASQNAPFTVTNAATSNLNEVMKQHGKMAEEQVGFKAALPTEAGQTFEGKYYRVIETEMFTGRLYKIDLMSETFDAYLYVKEMDGNIVALDDDAGEYTNARIFFQPKAAGRYQIWITTYGARETGSYTLQVRELSLTTTTKK